MFNEAIKRIRLDRFPFVDGKSLQLKENNKSECWLEPDETRKHFKYCPVNLRHIHESVLNTGMRRKQVLILKWQHIRGDWIYMGFDTKTGDAVTLPIGIPLKRLLEPHKGSDREKSSNVVDMKGEAVKRPKKRLDHVFLFRGQPVKNVEVALNALGEHAGIL